MLAGRNDVAPLKYYCSNMAQFSDDGVTFNGAYGYRWRHSFAGCDYNLEDGEQRHDYNVVDQLDIIVDHLKADPDSRRAVLNMWNVENDLLKIGQQELMGGFKGFEYIETKRGSKDVCCNLEVMFLLRPCQRCEGGDDKPQGEYIAIYPHTPYPQSQEPGTREVCEECGGKKYWLDITVTNRSNDMLWGLLGANYVHFSILQEYMAARLGVEVGYYHHFSNNLHVYCERPDWKPQELLGNEEFTSNYIIHDFVPLVQTSEIFEKELPQFVERNSGGASYSPCSWEERFLDRVAQPMLTTFRAHKEKWGGGTEMWLDRIEADDWRIAATNWLAKRKK
jgi:hypothetical protein